MEENSSSVFFYLPKIKKIERGFRNSQHQDVSRNRSGGKSGFRVLAVDWVLILDSSQAARIAPKILEYYPHGTPAHNDYTAMPT